MAVIFDKATYTNIMTLPKSTGRSFGAPLDPTDVWKDWAALQAYAASDATAYVGQIVVFSGKKTDDDPEVTEAYVISSEAGTLVKLASTTVSGDLASDVAALQSTVDGINSKIGTAAEGQTGTIYQLIAAAKAAADAAQAEAEEKVASVGAGTAVEIGGTATAPTVGVKVSANEGNALSVQADGLMVSIPEVVHPEYSIKKLDTATEGMSASYQLTKDNVAVGAVIDIPKDMVVESGEVKTFSAGSLPEGVTEAGTYIVLTLANKTNDKLYINVGNLIEYVTSGSQTGDMVVVNIDPTTHKVTATISDGTVTKAKLHADVQASLEKADSAVQSIVTGTENGTIKVDGAAVSVHGLGSAAYTESSAYDVAGAASDVQTALLGDTNTPAAETIRGVKKVADKAATDVATLLSGETSVDKKIENAIAGLDKPLVSAETGYVIGSIKQEDGIITATTKQLTEADIPTISSTKVSGLGTLATKSAVAETDLVEGLATKINNKADKATTLAGYGITNAMTDTEIADAISTAKTEAASDAQSKVDTAISGLVKTDTTETGKYVSAVSQTNGVITVTKTALPDYSEVYETKGAAALVLGSAENTAADNTVFGAKAAASAASSAAAGAQQTANTAVANAATAQSAAEAAQATADAKVASVAATANKGIEVGGTDTAPTIGIKLDPSSSVLSVGENGLKATIPAAAEYQVKKLASATAGYFASYQLEKDGAKAGDVINIPKDFLVKSASIEVSAGDNLPIAGFHEGDKYIDFVINAKEGGAEGEESHIYLNVQDLVDVYTGGNAIEITAANVVQVKIDSANANGLAATSAGLKLGTATTSSNGAMTSAHVTALETATSDISGLKTLVGNTAVSAQITNALGGLDLADASAPEAQYIKSVTQENGQVAVTKGTLAAVATSGLIDDLSIGADTTLVFDCGGANA